MRPDFDSDGFADVDDIDDDNDGILDTTEGLQVISTTGDFLTGANWTSGTLPAALGVGVDFTYTDPTTSEQIVVTATAASDSGTGTLHARSDALGVGTEGVSLGESELNADESVTFTFDRPAIIRHAAFNVFGGATVC